MDAECRKYLKGNPDSGIFIERWTFQTICCYIHKGICEECSNSIVCEKYTTKNPYRIKPVKYAMLLTYARLGAPRKYRKD